MRIANNDLAASAAGIIERENRRFAGKTEIFTSRVCTPFKCVNQNRSIVGTRYWKTERRSVKITFNCQKKPKNHN